MSIVYDVDKKNGRVIAKFADEDGKPTNDLWFSAIMRTLRKVDCTDLEWDTLLTIAKETLLAFPKKIGVAKLHPNDVFNEAVGKEIARKKLIMRFRKAQTHAMHKLVDITTQQAEMTTLRCIEKMKSLTKLS